MEPKLKHIILHLSYWIWFFFFIFYTMEEISQLKEISIGEAKIFMFFSTSVLIFIGFILYLFTIIYKISDNVFKKYLRFISLIFCIILFILFWYALKENSKLIIQY